MKITVLYKIRVGECFFVREDVRDSLTRFLSELLGLTPFLSEMLARSVQTSVGTARKV